MQRRARSRKDHTTDRNAINPLWPRGTSPEDDVQDDVFVQKRSRARERRATLRCGPRDRSPTCRIVARTASASFAGYPAAQRAIAFDP
jgi:hypothetical protein